MLRRMFLDAAIMLKGCPRFHLVNTWAGLLQPRATCAAAMAFAELQRRAADILHVLVCASLITLDQHGK